MGKREVRDQTEEKKAHGWVTLKLLDDGQKLNLHGL